MSSSSTVADAPALAAPRPGAAPAVAPAPAPAAPVVPVAPGASPAAAAAEPASLPPLGARRTGDTRVGPWAAAAMACGCASGTSLRRALRALRGPVAEKREEDCGVVPVVPASGRNPTREPGLSELVLGGDMSARAGKVESCTGDHKRGRGGREEEVLGGVSKRGSHCLYPHISAKPPSHVAHLPCHALVRQRAASLAILWPAAVTVCGDVPGLRRWSSACGWWRQM